MQNTLMGGLAATAYYLCFQLAGILAVLLLFRREKPLTKLLLGSAAGSLLFVWLPVPFAFFSGFSLTAHLLALLCLLPVFAAAAARRKAIAEDLRSLPPSVKEHKLFLMLLALFLLFWGYLLHTHTLLPAADGSLYTGQCTYGDMNMHLGFITSIAGQKAFPPDYSIMPGVRLSYPFLSDSVSSSLLLFGCSLRLAYILPMVFAMAQIFCTVYLFAHSLFGSLRKSVLTLLFFFCNGGLGFAYFINWGRERGYQFSDIFTGFYLTPANLVNENIRWVNVVADMFLPQRATLFGYAVLFPALWLLHQAAFRGRREYFPLAGLFAAALPMIHTHSFLSAGIVSAVWLLLWLRDKTGGRHGASAEPVPPEESSREDRGRRPWAALLAAFVLLMCLLQYLTAREGISPNGLMLTGLSIFIAAVIYGAVLLARLIKQGGLGDLLRSWGLFLLPVLILALPQLLFWTFGQVAQGGFVRGHFNWGNQGDFYPWFYLKNIGLPLLPILGGICACTRKKAPLFLPALFLWWLGELIVFTPNTYDNNKLLYVAYLLLCLGAADYASEFYDRVKELRGTRMLACAFLLFSLLSGALTLGRELVSRYQLYGAEQTALAEFVAENTPADAVFLTHSHHNNAIASLTGRNIVCGSDSFLYYHGLDTKKRREDMRLMFESPSRHLELYEQYHVSYVVISPFERANYHIDETAFQELFTAVYSADGVTLYRVEP